MNRIEWILIGLVAGSLLMACGKDRGRLKNDRDGATETQDGTPSIVDHPAITDLKPWIVEAGKGNPSLPTSETQSAERSVIVSGNVLYFENVVRISDLKSNSSQKVNPVFLCWEEKAFRSPILSAYYLYEKKDVLNEEVGDFGRRNVHYDKASGRWFVPLAEALGERYVYSDPNETHWITLELHLADVSVVYGKVGVRILGKLPEIVVQSLPLDHPGGNQSHFAKDVYEGMWVVGRESYYNPSSREVMLWLRLEASSLQWTTHLEQTTWSLEGGQNPNLVSHQNQFISPVPLIVKRIGVYSSLEPGNTNAHGANLPSLEFEGSKWKNILLRPFERLTLSWIAQAVENREVIQLPPSKSVEFRWTVSRRPVFDDFGKAGRSELVEYRETRVEEWHIKGVKLAGSWQRSVWLADPYLRESELFDVISERAKPLIQSQANEVSFRVNDTFDSGSPFRSGFIF